VMIEFLIMPASLPVIRENRVFSEHPRSVTFAMVRDGGIVDKTR
jgi:hypothetical protein